MEVARPQPCLTATCVATIRPQSEAFSFVRVLLSSSCAHF
jgi:hypothetical protein